MTFLRINIKNIMAEGQAISKKEQPAFLFHVMKFFRMSAFHWRIPAPISLLGFSVQDFFNYNKFVGKVKSLINIERIILKRALPLNISLKNSYNLT